jgi:hypothetical protein
MHVFDPPSKRIVTAEPSVHANGVIVPGIDVCRTTTAQTDNVSGRCDRKLHVKRANPTCPGPRTEIG